MHGAQDRIVPGNAAAIQSDKPFGGLAKFGCNFLSKFQVSETPSPLLESLTLIDTPGVLSGDKQRLGRSYDFAQICLWFAEHADLILVFFDAHKLDISDELKEVLTVLRPYDDKIRIILNKSDQVGRQELMRVYGALMWSLGKVVQTPEVMRVFISSFKPDLSAGDGRPALLQEEHDDLLEEMRQLPINSATRKINDLVKRARLAKVHALLINSLWTQMPSLFGKTGRQAKLLGNLAAEFTKVQQEFRLSPGDFPDIAEFGTKLRAMDLSSFPRLSTKMLSAINDALQVDIPSLMKRFPPTFGALFGVTQKNPFIPDSVCEFEDRPELWHFECIDRKKSDPSFLSLGPADGRLSGSKCRDFFLQCTLPEHEMASLWSLADIDQDGALTIEEFAIIMHLVRIRLMGGHIPARLPETLRPT